MTADNGTPASAESEPFDISELARETIAALQEDARAAGVELVLEVSDSLPPRVMLDPALTRRIIAALVSHAIRASVGERTTVHVQLCDDGNLLCVDVEERGREMGGDDPESVFAQPAATPGERAPGGGPTPTDARALAWTMNGEILVERNPGRGLTFHVTLPTIHLPEEKRTSHGAVNQASGEPVLAGLRVLAVDDHEANRLLLRHVLARAGASVERDLDGGRAARELEPALGSLLAQIRGYLEQAGQAGAGPGGGR
ncbi:MAG: Aerobic respiration control sensor protein ArcB [Calditrichaeota bacterium]|nr:Aerobic respiration control sensor protein ArcB [Calditrichota bacterium]